MEDFRKKKKTPKRVQEISVLQRKERERTSGQSAFCVYSKKRGRGGRMATGETGKKHEQESEKRNLNRDRRTKKKKRKREKREGTTERCSNSEGEGGRKQY